MVSGKDQKYPVAMVTKKQNEGKFHQLPTKESGIRVQGGAS